MTANILNNLKYLKIDKQVIYIKDKFCKLKGEYTSCNKSVAGDLKLKQGDDIDADSIYKETW
jgi:hypothetical protein